MACIDRKRGRQGQQGQGGMTLIEVMAASTLFVVIFSAVCMLIWSTRRLQSSVQDRETALFHLEGIAERIAALPFADIPNADPAIGFPADGTDISANSGVVETLAAEQITVAYPGWDWANWAAPSGDNGDTSLIPDPLTIRIVVTWNDSETGSPQTETLTVVRSNSV